MTLSNYGKLNQKYSFRDLAQETIDFPLKDHMASGKQRLMRSSDKI